MTAYFLFIVEPLVRSLIEKYGGEGSSLPSPTGKGQGEGLLPSPTGEGQGEGSSLPSPTGRGAGGEGIFRRIRRRIYPPRQPEFPPSGIYAYTRAAPGDIGRWGLTSVW